MTPRDARSVFEQYMAAVNGRNLTALEEVVHPDFQGEFPQSGEVTQGWPNLRRMVEEYPGAWQDLGRERIVGGEDRWIATPTFTLLRIEGTGNVFTGVQKARYPDGTDWHVVVIGEIKDGQVWRLQTFFAQDFEPPAWRSGFVEVRPKA